MAEKKIVFSITFQEGKMLTHMDVVECTHLETLGALAYFKEYYLNYYNAQQNAKKEEPATDKP